MPQQPQETVTTEMAIPHEIDSHHMLPPSRQPGMNVGECGKGLNDRERTDKRSCRINYITTKVSGGKTKRAKIASAARARDFWRPLDLIVSFFVASVSTSLLLAK